MGLEVSPDRPAASLIAQTSSARPSRRGPYVPPVADVSARTAGHVAQDEAGDAEDTETVATRCERILRGLLTGDGLDDLFDDLAPDVVVWSPTLFTTSRDATIDALRIGVSNGETLTDLSIQVTNLDIVPPRAYLEWRLVGRFTNPCFVNDDLLVPPTGRLVETAGTLVITLVRRRAVAVHCYYDDLAMLEQFVAS